MNRWMRFLCVASVCACLLGTACGQPQDRNASFTAVRDDELPAGQPRRSLTEDEMVKLRQQELLLDFAADTSLDHGETINPELVRTIKNNSMGVRFEEREAYLRVLRLAQEVPLRRQEKFAADWRRQRRELNANYAARPAKDFPQFVDLFTHPEEYQGHPVTLHGVMRKMTKFDLGKNSYDLDQAYEGWIYTTDSQRLPAVVVFTSKDERLLAQGDMQEEVQFTGYMFKMYGYDAADTTRKAPLILAGEVEWMPHPYRSAYRPISPLWYGVTTLAFLLILYVIWQTNRHEMPPRPPLQVEPDFTHFPPRHHPAPDPFLPHSMIEPEDS